MKKGVITFLPINKSCNIDNEKTILEVAKNNQIYIDGICGGKTACGKCKIRIIQGTTNPLTEKEKNCLTEKEIDENYRLACEVKINTKVMGVGNEWVVLLTEKKKEQTEKKKKVVLPEGFYPDEYEDTSHINVDNLEKINRKCGKFGIAFDIGTTTIVAILWDLTNAQVVEVIAKENPQRIIGADILSRMQYTNENKQHINEVKQMTINVCNEMIESLFLKLFYHSKKGMKDVNSTQFIKNNLTKVVVVGNTAMLHFFMGYSTATLSKYPFLSIIKESIVTSASNIGLIGSEDTKVEVVNIISGQIGSDITAAILSTGIMEMENEKNELLIDIGTNGEMVLRSNWKILACSTAAGPAFEGGSIYSGMRAEEGAIQGITLEGGDIQLDVIGNIVAKGICGSGLINIVSDLLDWGVIDETGRIIDSDEARGKGISFGLCRRIIYEEDGSNSFILKFGANQNKIILKQNDIRELQVAKSAICSGIETLLREKNLEIEELDCIKIAGTFGNYLNKEKAIRIGLFPNIDKEKLVFVGNAAGTGASMILLSKKYGKKANILSKYIERLELSENKNFSEYYFQNMNFKKLG